eukprot:sb/3473224/
MIFTNITIIEPTSKQPIRTCYLGHVTGGYISWRGGGKLGINFQYSKHPIRTRYLDHVSVTGYQPIRDQYFLIRSVAVSAVLHTLRVTGVKERERERERERVGGQAGSRVSLTAVVSWTPSKREDRRDTYADENSSAAEALCARTFRAVLEDPRA